MTMVRFATTCDRAGCGKRSPEFSAWPECDVCGGHICPVCTEPGSEWDEEGDVETEYGLVAYCRPMVRCRACAADATKHEARA